jgi:hypothetical protein
MIKKLLIAMALFSLAGRAMAINFDEGFDKGKLPANQITVDTSNFSSHLSSADKDVQHALETLDQLVILTQAQGDLRWLSISATAADSAKLNGQSASYYLHSFTETDPLSWHLTGDQSSLSGTKSGTYNLSTTGTLGAGAITGTSITIGSYTLNSLLQSRSFIITNPTSSADGAIWRVPYNITIVAVHVLCVGGTNIVGQLWEYDSNGANGATVDSSDITGTAGTNVNDDGTLSNPAIASGNYLGWKTTSVSGAVNQAIISFDYQVN